MKKSMGIVLGVISVAFLAVSVNAAIAARGAKAYKTINFSATAQELCSGPGAVYAVWASSAAVTDYVVLRDSATANTSSTAAIQVSPSATLNTQNTFDPPVQFNNGISVNAPATNRWTTVIYECGRVVQGY